MALFISYPSSDNLQLLQNFPCRGPALLRELWHLPLSLEAADDSGFGLAVGGFGLGLVVNIPEEPESFGEPGFA